MAKFYITNAIPYVNAKPHIGHALEFIQSDTIARYHKLLGEEVALSCGADENSLKNVQAAEAEKVSVQNLVDRNFELFQKLWEDLSADFQFVEKGSNQPRHFKSSQKLWQLCAKNGDIYKKTYAGLYCVGCEQFYEKEELNEKGECFEHAGKPLEKVSEENYFFKLSKYTDRILKLIDSNELAVVPEFRKNEVLAFLKKGLEDISISRTNKRAKNWGVPVPGDDSQRMYVWFDALNIYQTSVGFGWDEKLYKKWWPADIHVIGKGIIRFHAVYWPSFLMSAGLTLPKKLFVHEYITVNGQKMSKTLGNVIDPNDLIQKYGADALRYYCLAKISPFSDSDFSEAKMTEIYNADLANGLGNLISRVAKLCENADYTQMGAVNSSSEYFTKESPYTKALSEFRFPDALSFVWERIAELDKYINDEKPWELAKTDLDRLKSVLAHCVDRVQEISTLLKPFMPTTSKTILEQFKGPKIKSRSPLFPRS